VNNDKLTQAKTWTIAEAARMVRDRSFANRVFFKKVCTITIMIPEAGTIRGGTNFMSTEKPRLPLLDQRELEARIVGPLIRAFAAEIGDERALVIVREVIAGLARESGAELAQVLGEQTLEAFAESLARWRENGALEIEVLEQSPSQLSFNVTRCRYAEMYRELGLADLGSSLSCQRDFALVQGFNSEIQLTRTQTIMGGASFCDFRFRLPDHQETHCEED
jgi:hypothetical protein